MDTTISFYIGQHIFEAKLTKPRTGRGQMLEAETGIEALTSLELTSSDA